MLQIQICILKGFIPIEHEIRPYTIDKNHSSCSDSTTLVDFTPTRAFYRVHRVVNTIPRKKLGQHNNSEFPNGTKSMRYRDQTTYCHSTSALSYGRQLFKSALIRALLCSRLSKDTCGDTHCFLRLLHLQDHSCPCTLQQLHIHHHLHKSFPNCVEQPGIHMHSGNKKSMDRSRNEKE